MVPVQTLLDILERLGQGALILILERHLLHVRSKFHEIGVRPDMRLLLLLVAVDPDFTSIFLSCNQLLLLIDLV